jgi:hypothetical protein
MAGDEQINVLNCIETFTTKFPCTFILAVGGLKNPRSWRGTVLREFGTLSDAYKILFSE